MTDIVLAPGVAKASKRGRKAGTKVPSVPWTTAEEAQLNSMVHAWSAAPKKALWLTAAKELGTHRTPASCEQHFYYAERQQRAQVQSSTPVTGGGVAPKPKVRVRVRVNAHAPHARKRRSQRSVDVLPSGRPRRRRPKRPTMARSIATASSRSRPRGRSPPPA